MWNFEWFLCKFYLAQCLSHASPHARVRKVDQLISDQKTYFPEWNEKHVTVILST